MKIRLYNLVKLSATNRKIHRIYKLCKNNYTTVVYLIRFF